jgi:5-methyltetrahydrofolate--homocysteine methyltransferase
MSREEEIKKGLYDHTLVGNAAEVKQLTNEGLALRMDPLDILFGALIPSLQEVGRLFEIGEYFVPEMLISARAMQGAMEILRPLLADTGAEPIGKVVMLTVKGDVHDIGKNLCNIMLEGEGFEVIDLGVNVKPERIVEVVKEHQPQLVGFSAFLTTTMPFFKTNLKALQEAGLRDQVKVMVGGAPVTQEYADSVGADGYAPDASAAVRLAKRLMVEMGYDVSLGDSRPKEGASALSVAVDAVETLMGKADKVHS